MCALSDSYLPFTTKIFKIFLKERFPICHSAFFLINPNYFMWENMFEKIGLEMSPTLLLYPFCSKILL